MARRTVALGPPDRLGDCGRVGVVAALAHQRSVAQHGTSRNRTSGTPTAAEPTGVVGRPRGGDGGPWTYSRYSGTVSTLALDIAPVSGVIGAEIHGLDLAAPLPDDTVADVRRAFNEHQVMFFRDQKLDGRAALAFGRRFGKLGTHPYVEGERRPPRSSKSSTSPTIA